MEEGRKRNKRVEEYPAAIIPHQFTDPAAQVVQRSACAAGEFTIQRYNAG